MGQRGFLLPHQEGRSEGLRVLILFGNVVLDGGDEFGNTARWPTRMSRSGRLTDAFPTGRKNRHEQADYFANFGQFVKRRPRCGPRAAGELEGELSVGEIAHRRNVAGAGGWGPVD